MRRVWLVLPLLTACTSLPGMSGLLSTDPAYSQIRGQVELLVKTNHAALLEQIAAGQGPLLTEALDTAGVPPSDRPARVLQLQGDLSLYTANPEALVVALMLYGTP
jgi:hypothetical protein